MESRKHSRPEQGLSGRLKDFFSAVLSFSYASFFLTAGFAFSRLLGNTHMQKFFAVRKARLSEVRSNVLFRYIAKELLLYFMVCFAFFFVVFFVNQILLLAETILKKRVPVFTVLRLIWYCLPAIVAQSAPFATLVGFLMCLGRLVTDNEILIFRASGLRYRIVLNVVVMMGVAISVFSFAMNDYFLPLGTINYNKLYRQIIVSNPSIELESKSIKRMGDTTLVIGDVNREHVSDIVMIERDHDNKLRLIVAKDTDVLKSKQSGVMMQLKMDNATVFTSSNDRMDDYDMITAGKMYLNIFEDTLMNNVNRVSPREMTSWDLYKKIGELRKDPNIIPKLVNSYKVEYNKKFSIPFGSFFFALVAFPLALVFGRKDGQTLGLIFGIIISVLYWAATIIGQIFGIRGGYNAFLVMWTPNILIGFLGIILYLRLRQK